MVNAKPINLLSDRVLIVALILLVAGVVFLFLAPAYLEFPMDDTYIHLIYAENLAETGKLFFSFKSFSSRSPEECFQMATPETGVDCSL